MRVNVYSEEVRDRVELRTKEVNGVVFNGIEFLVGDPFEHTPGDDDSSAVTFWFNSKYTRETLESAFKKALMILSESATH